MKPASTRFAAPPHPRGEVERVRQTIVLLARRLASPTDGPGRLSLRVLGPEVHDLLAAVHELDRLEAANAEWREERRQAHLSKLIHLTAEPGSKTLLCGQDSSTAPHGWGRADFVEHWLAHGQTICTDCLNQVPTQENPQ
jgi:hypothetical protein